MSGPGMRRTQAFAAIIRPQGSVGRMNNAHLERHAKASVFVLVSWSALTTVQERAVEGAGVVSRLRIASVAMYAPMACAKDWSGANAGETTIAVLAKNVWERWYALVGVSAWKQMPWAAV